MLFTSYMHFIYVNSISRLLGKNIILTFFYDLNMSHPRFINLKRIICRKIK